MTCLGDIKSEERHKLIRVLRTAENITGVSLPYLLNIYKQLRALGIAKDPTYPSVFSLMQSEKTYVNIHFKSYKTSYLLALLF